MMKRFLILLTVAAALGCASSAHAVTLISGKTGLPMGRPWTTWVAQMKVPTVPGNVVVTLVAPGLPAGPCGQYARGCSEAGQIWLSLGQPLSDQRQVLYHELGAQAELEPDLLSAADRAAFEQTWGLPADWWQTFPAPGYVIPANAAEWFTEAYRLCANFGMSQKAPKLFVRFGGGWRPFPPISDFPGYDRRSAMSETCAMIANV